VSFIVALSTALLALMARPDADGPSDQFVNANGVRLHHVDWGGQGETILFLPGLAGLAGSVHRFDTFAPRFTQSFHVRGLTRRGQAESQKPASGYDTETLVGDIRAFLDAELVQNVDLIGHSIAGFEMTAFAKRHPNRVRHLVYLDAAYDMAKAYETAMQAQVPVTPSADPEITAIDREARQTRLDYRSIEVPARILRAVRPSRPVTADVGSRKGLEPPSIRAV